MISLYCIVMLIFYKGIFTSLRNRIPNTMFAKQSVFLQLLFFSNQTISTEFLKILTFLLVMQYCIIFLCSLKTVSWKEFPWWYLYKITFVLFISTLRATGKGDVSSHICYFSYNFKCSILQEFFTLLPVSFKPP